MRNYCAYLPETEWPKADREAKMTVGEERRPSLLRKPRVGELWRARTLQTNVDAYGHYLGWLHVTGRLDTEIKERFTLAFLKEYLHYICKRVAGQTVRNRFVGLDRAVAAFWPEEVDRTAFRRLQRMRPPRTAKSFLLDDTPTSPQILEEASRLMRQAERRTSDRLKVDAVMFRDGLQMALMVWTALRRENIASISIGKNLEKVEGLWWLRFEAKKMKNNKPYEIVLPEPLVEPLERYLDFWRPTLGNASSNALWLTYRNRAQSGRSLYSSTTVRTRKSFGKPINPHKFRAIAATEMAQESASGVIDAGLILCDQQEIAARHYIRVNRSKFVEETSSLIERLRQKR